MSQKMKIMLASLTRQDYDGVQLFNK